MRDRRTDSGAAASAVEVWLRTTFTGVRAYHAGRPASVAGVLKRGLRPLTQAGLRRSLRAFLRIHGAAVTETDIARVLAFVSRNPELTFGRVWLSLDARDYETACGHYLLYGSETPNAVVANLPGGEDLRERLRDHGAPTVFMIEVPIAALRQGTLTEIAELVVDELSMRESVGPTPVDYGFSVPRSVPGDWVCGHYHPSAVADPYHGFRVRPVVAAHCDACRQPA